MNGARAFRWFGAATLATLALLHPGYDVSEGSDHARTALHWLETGRLGQSDRPSGIFVQGPDGLYYPAHELGNIVWLTPAAAAGLAAERALGVSSLSGTDARLAVLAASFFPVLLVTLIALGFWKLLQWGFAVEPRTCAAASALLVFATMLLPYSRWLGDVVATACWLTWGAAFAARASAGRRRGAAAMAGFCLGCAFLTRLPAGAAILPIVAAMIAKAARADRVRLGVTAIAAGLPALAALLWFNDLRTGSPWVPGLMHPQYAPTQPGSGSLAAGIAGLLVSPAKSLFLFSPVLLIAAAGVPAMLRRARVDALMVIATLVLFLLTHGSLRAWHGDWGWGPRYVVMVLPLLWLPAVFAADAIRASAAARRAAAVLIAASVAVQIAATIVNWQYQYQLMRHDGRMTNAMYWSADNQFTDAMRGASMNLARMAGAAVPARDVPGVSHQTLIASTGVNVWWVTALRLGLPPAAVLGAAGALAAFAWLAWRRVRGLVRG